VIAQARDLVKPHGRIGGGYGEAANLGLASAGGIIWQRLLPAAAPPPSRRRERVKKALWRRRLRTSVIVNGVIPGETAMPTSFDDRARPEQIERLLVGAPTIRNACDLDLLAFLYRHPRILLTSERLAGFVGYDLKDVARALDAFIEAGLLARTAQRSLHAARMFVLRLDGPHGEGTRRVLELARKSRISWDASVAARRPTLMKPCGAARTTRCSTFR
jgi:hypothetical protein